MTESRTVPHVLLTACKPLTGLTVPAMRQKINRGQWILGREVFKAPDGRIYLNITRYNEWVESAMV